MKMGIVGKKKPSSWGVAWGFPHLNENYKKGQGKSLLSKTRREVGLLDLGSEILKKNGA